MGKNDLTSLCVHLWVLFLKKNRNKESVLFQKKKKKIPDTSGWGLSLSCETRVVVNSYGRDWSREIVKPNLWRNSAFSDQSPTIQPSLLAPRSSLLAPRSSQLKVSRNVPCCEKRGARNDGWRLPRFASYFLKDSLQPVGAIICRLL